MMSEASVENFSSSSSTVPPPPPPPVVHGPDASDVFLKSLTCEVNKEDVYKMIEVQQHMLSRFEKTNEMLLNFNGLSNARYESTQKEFRRHIQLLVDTKKDLDSIFRRIRILKSKLGKQYPKAFTACAQVYKVPDDDEDDKDEDEERRKIKLRVETINEDESKESKRC